MELQSISDWIYGTPLSSSIRNYSWVVPVVQSIHIIAIAAVVGSVIVMELRIAGVLAGDEDLGSVMRRYLPWLWRSLAVLLVTGTTLIIGEPDRTLSNPFFWTKVALIIIAATLSVVLRRPLRASGGPSVRPPSKSTAWLSIVIWVIVIVCGRWIAYST